MLARARGLGTCPGIDSSAHVYPAGPVKFTLGERKVIEGLEEAVLNMHVGEGCCTAEPRTTLFLYLAGMRDWSECGSGTSGRT